MNRKEMMHDCPDEFKLKLEEILNHFEYEIGSVKDDLDFTCLEDLANIATAFSKTEQLLKDLY